MIDCLSSSVKISFNVKGEKMSKKIKKQSDFGTEPAENLCQHDRLSKKYFAL